MSEDSRQPCDILDAIETMRFIAEHSPDPIAASTAESVARILSWAIGNKEEDFEAMLRQTKAEIDAARASNPFRYVTDIAESLEQVRGCERRKGKS